MVRKVLLTLALGGGLALGTLGVASAATPSNGGTKTPDCSKAPAALSHIATAESRISTRLPEAKNRLAQAQTAGRTVAVARIEAVIAKVNARQVELTSRLQRIEAACPGATAS
jgi:hypothetical protein